LIEQPAETAVTPLADGPDEDVRDETVRDAFARFYADARAYAAAEAEKQKLRAGIIATSVRNAAILGVVALMLVFATLVALLVGLILALQSRLGAMGATFTVVGGGLLVAVILLLLAKGCITRMKRAIAS
jgi:2-keto-3-deoxy-galactonokinase